MFRCLLPFFLLLFPIYSFCPQSNPSRSIISESADMLITDNIGNSYLISGDHIRKFNPSGVFQKEFSNKNFGAITTADATNPLRILLFYRDFSRILFLDNTLSQNGEPVQLEALGFPIATLTCTSYDNGTWIYDQQNFELIRMNRNLQIQQRTGNLAQQLGINLQPNFILEKDNRLFLNNPSTGILIFDVFGTYSKTIPIKNLNHFQVDDDAIVWYQNPQIRRYELLTNEESVYEQPSDSSAVDMRLEKGSVFVQYKDSTIIYSRR